MPPRPTKPECSPALGCAGPLHGGRRLRDQQVGGDARFVGRGRAGAVRPRTTAGLQDHSDDRLSFRYACPGAQRAGNLNWGETVAGRRVVLSTDGGRIRIRTTKRGPKTAKGRNRYRTDWREPKLLVIYVVDEKGQMDREFLAVSMGPWAVPTRSSS